MFYNSPLGNLQIKAAGNFVTEIIFINEEINPSDGVLTSVSKKLLRNVSGSLMNIFQEKEGNLIFLQSRPDQLFNKRYGMS